MTPKTCIVCDVPLSQIDGTTHAYAFFDQVVLVTLQFAFQSLRLCRCLSLPVFHPSLVGLNAGFRVVFCRISDNIKISPDIMTLLCFRQGEFQCVNSQDFGGGADANKTIKTRCAYVNTA